MNPLSFQSSTGCPLNGNATHCPGSPLPRSFKLICHGMLVDLPVSGGLIAHLGPNPPEQRKRLRTHSRTSQGCISPFYQTSLGRSLRMQHAHQRNAKVLSGIVCYSEMVKKNTFFSSGRRREEKGSRRPISGTYTLLDYIALNCAQGKTSKKGTK